MKKCIGCGNEIKTATGHIHTEIGKVIVGWCGIGGYCERNSVRPNVAPDCTSVNPSSCYGRFKLSDIELMEPINEQTLLAHSKSEEFSRRIDMEVRGINAPQHKKPKSFWELLFG